MGVTRLRELIAATETNPNDLDAWFNLGKYTTDRFIVGIGEEALTKVVKERPDDAEVIGLLAKALNRRRKFVEAEKVYLKALDLEPDSPELLTGLAVVYGNQGELEKAIPYYSRALEINNGHSWAVHGYIHVLGALGQENEKIPLLERALKTNPDSALINVLYGLEQKKRGNQVLSRKHIEQGFARIDNVDCEEQSRTLRMIMDFDPDSVITFGTRILQDDPDNMDIELFVTLASSRMNPKGAVQKMKEMLNRDPNNPRIIGMMIPMMLATGDVDAALEFKKRLETTAPEDDLIKVANMVLTKTRPGELFVSEKARESYVESTRDILKRLPVSPHAHLEYIQALMTVHRYEEAKEQVKKVLKDIKMENVTQYLSFARILRTLRFFEESREQYQTASSMTETPYAKLLIEMDELVELEKYSDIVVACNKFLEHNEATPELYALLGRAQHYVNDDEARTNLEIAAEAGNYEGMMLLSNILRKEGDEQRADDMLQEVMTSKGLHTITMARCLLGLRQFDKASEVLKKYLEQHRTDVLGWYLLALNERREGEQAVKRVMRKMLESMMQGNNADDAEVLSQRLEVDKGVDEFTTEVMVGEVGEKVKHMLLLNQVRGLLFAEVES
ncbi:MAG: tetratricopeptide repeat protein [Candidatus Thorarchaeota archaeon]|nr:tetratricopeptide repeat protein [Candidatus Thorarchaeota archaeon]